MEILQAEGVPAGVANNGRDLEENPQSEHNGYFSCLFHPIQP